MISKIADRSYQLHSTPDELRTFFALLGFTHHACTPGGLATDRWVHDGAGGRTVLTLFPSGRLSVLGPPVGELDGITIVPVEVRE